MKIKLPLIAVIAIASITVSCKKDLNNTKPPVVKLTGQDNGKTTTVSQGQIIQLILGNPGDGGYDFDAPQYKTGTLILQGHVHTPPQANALIGDFGTDTWSFKAVQSGPATITITATRGSDASSTAVMFTGTVDVE